MLQLPFLIQDVRPSQNQAKNSFASLNTSKDMLLPALPPGNQAKNSFAPPETQQQRHATSRPGRRNAEILYYLEKSPY